MQAATESLSRRAGSRLAHYAQRSKIVSCQAQRKMLDAERWPRRAEIASARGT